MTVTGDTIRDLCTDAVYERGENYLADGRIQQPSRFDDTTTAVVSGSRDYDQRLDLDTGATKDQLESAMAGAVITQAQLEGTYAP